MTKEEKRIYMKNWWLTHKEKKKEYDKKYIKNHKEIVNASKRKYDEKLRRENPEKIKSKRRKYLQSEKGRKKSAEQTKKYYHLHNEEFKIKWKEKYENNSTMRINNVIHASIGADLRGRKSRMHWEEIVGWTIGDLTKYFKEKFNFDIKDLTKKIHLDHIIPKSLYKFESYEDEEFKKCWNMRNLRPVEARTNLKKHNKLLMELVIEYEIQDLLPNDFSS